MKIAILGAGNVALANAGYLASKGHDVHIWSAFAAERDALASAGHITFEGAVSGSAKITVANDPGKAIAGAGMVMVAAPAFGHEALMTAAAPHIEAGQDVLVHPVTGLSSLLLSRMLKARDIKPTIIDVSTSLFTTRKTGPASTHILKVKDLVEIAAIPAGRNEQAMARLEAVFGKRFRLEPNALAISLNNHNPVYHVPPLICNLSRAEKRENWMIWDSITPGVARFVELADEERLAVVRRYGTREVTVADYFREAHGAKGESLYEVFQSVAKILKGPIGPQTMDHRFVTEDVPYALVFFRALGEVAGLDMPITDSLIRITNALYARDFVAEGHTMARLGLAGKSPAEIVAMTETGF